MDRRNFVVGSAAAAAALATRTAGAQSAYPTHAITVINPFPPGGASDVVTRPLVAVLEPIVKQPVVIETKAGAAGQVGAQVAANAKPDGYTLLTHITSISGFAEVDRLFGRTPKFTNADFIPIARIVADPCLLVVNDKQPYKTLQDFIDDAKKRPDQIIFSSSGLYGALHIPMALLMKAAGGLKLRHLPTNGGGPALTALLGDNSQVLASSVSAALSQIKAGKVRPLALFGGQRSKALAGPADLEGARLRHRILPLGRDVRAQEHAGQRHHLSARRHQQGRARRSIQDRADQSRSRARLHGPGGVREILGGRHHAHRGRGASDRPRGGMTFATPARSGEDTP